MKTITIFVSIILSSNLYSQEIVCIPDMLTAPFDSIELKKLKANKYLMKAMKNDIILASDEVSYVFLRRKQYARFRNKIQSIEIKTKKLFANHAQKSLLRIESLEKMNYSGFCKLY
jgi:putative methionine-R-sulfoxide reductase with GAF domain